MAIVEFKGKKFEVDEDGFLLKFEDWNPEWVEYVKESEGIAVISENHQKVIDFLQDYYKKNGIAPMVRIPEPCGITVDGDKHQQHNRSDIFHRRRPWRRCRCAQRHVLWKH